MKIIKAEHLGMCFGVRDAIELATKTARLEPLTILGDLVHNETVLTQLRGEGIQFELKPESVGTSKVMITAHGTSERTLSHVRKRGLTIIEATCPLVHVAHRALAKLVAEGAFPVIIGKRDHVEVRGMTDDLAEYDVILSPEDVSRLCNRPRFGVIAQTTQPIGRVRELVELIRQRFPRSDVRFTDTVCQPTKQRQQAAADLAIRCDVVIVIGGTQSNNTHELVATCIAHCKRVHHARCADDLRAEWFCGNETVGITAGTSTPDMTIRSVETWLEHRFTAAPNNA